MTNKADLEWYISNGELKADSDNGSYIVAVDGKGGFQAQFHPYPVDLTPTFTSLIDCIKACEEYHVDLVNHADTRSLEAKFS